jgi:dGTPase
LNGITTSPTILQAMLELRQFLYRSVYALSIPKKEFLKAKKMLSDIYYYALENQEQLLAKSKRGCDSLERCATDFIAGMTDRFAINLYSQLFLPKAWNPF